MRRLAKAVSAQFFDGSGQSGSRRSGRAFATRGASRDANGSGAPANRRRKAVALVSLVALLSLVVGAALALGAAKKTDSFVGSPTGASGTTGGLFNTPRGIAVNQAGIGGAGAGDYYVADASNNRIQQFTAAGAFVRAWGTDVVSPAVAGNANEMQAVTVNATAGQFTLTFGAGGVGVGTTADIAFNATAAQVQSALNGLTNISTGGGSVAVSGGPGDAGGNTPYLVNFNGAPLAGTNVAQMTGASGTTPLSGGTGSGANAATVTTFAEGGGAGTSFEICEVAANCKAGVASVTGGGMGAPQGVAVNQATGNVYVTDQTEVRVDEFDAKGNFIRSWGQDVVSSGPHNSGTGPEICTAGDVCKVGTTGSVGGAFKTTFASNLAVAPVGSPNAGDVYVADPANFRIQEFTAAGAFVRTWGKGVNETAVGEGFEICTAISGNVCKIGVTGTEAGAFGSNTSATRVAVDSTGKVFAVDVANRRVQAFDASGANPTIFFAPPSGGLNDAGPTDVAIGPANSVFVLQPCSSQSTTTAVTCPGGVNNESRIKELNSAGVLQSTSLALAGFTTVNGLAANLGNDKVYFSSSAGSAGMRVWAIDNDGALPAPAVTINDPTEITAHSASFSGTVNPNGPTGISTSYHFEYSKNGVTWTAVAADANLGEGVSPVNVPTVAAQGEVSGLQANTIYRVRIVATKAFGAGSTISAEKSFLTDVVGPEIQDFFPQATTDTSARLVAQLNANNLPTTYHFEIGKTTSYGTKLPVPDGTASDGIAHLVFQDATGLEPETTYHYCLVATNAEGTTKGEDISFKTRAAGVAAAPDRGFEMLTPPFKTSPSASKYGPTANTAFPSLDGERVLWNVVVFPINNEVEYPYAGDIVEMTRGADGWVSKSLLTHRPPSYEISVGAKGANWMGASGDLGVQQWSSSLAMLPIPGGVTPPGSAPRFQYTRRNGTGEEGFTAWNPTVLNPGSPKDQALFNDDGSWMARFGEYRNLLGPQDSSAGQLAGAAGGQTIYLQHEAPTGTIELVNGCTGIGGSATQIPARIGTGSAATDTIGTQACEEDIGVLAAGSGTRTPGSPTLTGVSTGSGAFAVGQVISGTGIPGGATITAIGAGTLTLSANAECGQALGSALTTIGSPVLTGVYASCGAFAVGQTVIGTNIPAATTIVAVGGDHTLTLSANATASTNAGGTTLTVAAPAVTSLSARAKSVVSVRGATVGGFVTSGGGSSASFADTAMSNDGRRVFFESPDPAASGVPSTGCAAGAGTATNCGPQLYVRQYDANHENPVVRWISQSKVAGQQIGLMGTATGFQGASRDGSVVYFRSNAPLTADDPNGAGVAPPVGGVVTGTASANSMDLFKYELPSSGDPSTGTLTRISGGPPATATATDPNGANARYVSDDGKRVYFVTNAPIAAADSTPPSGGITTPGGTPTGTARNLYVFDDTKTGADRYRFIAQIPSTDKCAVESQPEGPAIGLGASVLQRKFENKCFRGTQSGDVVTFMSNARLTADDTDNVEDVYVYDLRRDELTRISAPLPGESGYECQNAAASAGRTATFCNGDLGFGGYNRSNDDTKRGWGGDRQNNIGVDAEGHVSVYFESASRLVPEDTNGNHWDTYQWREGKVSLVSPGNAPNDAYYSGNSLDGRNVFMQTSQQIDPRDVSAADFDIYDARIGGGFPYEKPPTPCDVLALKCEGNAIAAPAVATPASRGFQGTGNVKGSATKPKCAKGKVRRNGRCVKKKSHKAKGKRTANTKQGSGK